MGSSHPYFAKGQRNPLESCDILLKLDDGTELPAHIQVLARCMPIFDDMLAGGPLAKASVTNVVRVPFSDCSLEEARHFLAAIYSIEASEYIDERSALSSARLSHKDGGEVRSLAVGAHPVTLGCSCFIILAEAKHPCTDACSTW